MQTSSAPAKGAHDNSTKEHFLLTLLLCSLLFRSGKGRHSTSTPHSARGVGGWGGLVPNVSGARRRCNVVHRSHRKCRGKVWSGSWAIVRPAGGCREGGGGWGLCGGAVQGGGGRVSWALLSESLGMDRGATCVLWHKYHRQCHIAVSGVGCVAHALEVCGRKRERSPGSHTARGHAFWHTRGPGTAAGCCPKPGRCGTAIGGQPPTHRRCGAHRRFLAPSRRRLASVVGRLTTAVISLESDCCAPAELIYGRPHDVFPLVESPPYVPARPTLPAPQARCYMQQTPTNWGGPLCLRWGNRPCGGLEQQCFDEPSSTIPLSPNKGMSGTSNVDSFFPRMCQSHRNTRRHTYSSNRATNVLPIT